MTIDRTAIKSNMAPTFGHLGVGDVFLDLEDNLICMKINPSRYTFSTNGSPDFNAIDLSDGEELFFGNSGPVLPLNAKLVVEPT